jgi:hypothetical protein
MNSRRVTGSASPCFGRKTIAQSVRQETAAPRNFDPAYVSNGSISVEKVSEKELWN